MMEGISSVIAEKAVDVQSLCILAILGTLHVGYYRWAMLPAAILAAEWTVVIMLVRGQARLEGPLVGRSDPRPHL